jgi:uncharacterized repeat protein (TIGR01451 family)
MKIRSVLLLSALLLTLGSHALSVTVYGGSATCGNNTGYAYAWANGGSPPYTFQWNNGATTDTITGLAPGTYSVTVTDANSDQASDMVTLGNSSGPIFQYDWSTLGLQGCHGQCNGGIWYDEFAMPLNLVPPFSFSTPLTYGLDPNNLLQGAWVGFCPGFTGTFTTVTDALGCVAQLQLWNPIPASDPTTMNVLSTTPTCSGLYGGSMVVDLGWDPGPVGQNWQRTLLDANMQPVAGVNINAFPSTTSNIATIGGRMPGDYYVERRFQNFYSGDCVDLQPVTIPDLGPNCGMVSGTAYVDADENCFMAGAEARVPNGVVEVLPGPYYATLGGNGAYLLNLPPGNYTLTQSSPAVEEHCTGAPIPFTVNAGATTTRNLPDTSVVPLDLEVMVSSGAARPGFQFQCAAVVRNLTPTSSGNITLVMTFDPLLTYVSSTPAGTLSGNTITWSQAQLTAWQQRNVVVSFQVPANPALIGTQLATTAVVSSVGNDPVPANNTATDLRTITGSYDPNDKRATTSTGDTAQWTIGEDEWVDYVIRFQNTGTDTAFNIVITDTLPVDLDPVTIVMGAASHPFTWQIEGQGTLKFLFPNILLPDSNINEPLSHGFVGFRIRPRLPLLPGDVIANVANIYFDFNPPVITEPSILTVDFSTGIATGTKGPLRVFPNPAHDRLLLVLPAGADRFFTLLGADGRVFTVSARPVGNGLELDIAALAPGLYVVCTAQGSARFVKQ